MLGIQLFGAPSRNLKACVASNRCAQNMGISGSETTKPAIAKMLAIQRIASLFSLGTNMSRIAPTSGVNRTIESMWFCIKSSSRFSVASCQISSDIPSPMPYPWRNEQPTAVTRYPSAVRIIRNKTQQSGDHDQRVPLHQSPLQETGGIGQGARQRRRPVHQQAVNNPFVPPHREPRRGSRAPARTINGAINHVHISPRRSIA